jgi:hypothetical protein
MHDKQATIYKTMGWDKHQLQNLEQLRQAIYLSAVKTHYDIVCGTGDFGCLASSITVRWFIVGGVIKKQSLD